MQPSIHLESAEIVLHQSLAGDQWLLRLHAPQCASTARAGCFVHLQCDPERPLRRPLSLLRSAPQEGWIEILYKRIGEGTRLLSQRRPGERLSVLGPIGNGFQPGVRKRPLLLGGGLGIPPVLFLAEQLRVQSDYQPMAFLASEIPFPFPVRPSQLLIPGLPATATGCMPLLDDWNIPSRLASRAGLPGCYEGFITDLARCWLKNLDASTLEQVEIFACGPHPMLEATALLARELALPSQLSLEEFMACGVGGCAGCTVPITTPQGLAMKRVCVDGPVFPGNQVFP